MHETNRTCRAWKVLVRAAALVCSAVLLVGCVMPSAYVQPNANGSGGYYTSASPYTGQGYYDAYGTGPYYAGTSGWDYYGGEPSYTGAFGYYGGYAGYGAWPRFAFGIGISSIWDFPSYWGPWYTTTLPFWGRCRHRYCGRYRYHHHYDTRGGAPRPWLHRDRALVSPLAHATRVYRPSVDLADNRAARVAAFAHDHFVHAPVRQNLQPRLHGTSMRSMYRPHPSAFRINRHATRMPEASMSRNFRALPRAAPLRARPVRSRSVRPVAVPRLRGRVHTQIP
ncbi:MAG: hypothetical protein ACREPY_01210 [Rhodanobacteraceae bacterium]